MKMLRTSLALLLAIGLAGCGSTTLGPSSAALGRASSSSANITSAQAVELASFNDSGDLDDLADENLVDLDESGVDASVADASVQGLFTKGSTRMGYVRSTEDGKFFLQTKQGIWKAKDVSIALTAKNEAVTLKLAKELNCKVLLRGASSGTTMTVNKAYAVPDISILVDLLRTGCVEGKIYSAKTFVGQANAAVTLRAIDSGRIYRATSKKDGKYHIGRLPAGDYTLEAALAGFDRGTLPKVTVSRRREAAGNVPLNPAS